MAGRFAAFTIARNEALFLPAWCRYYSSVFGENSCYVIDNDSTDGSIEAVKQRFPGIAIEAQHHEEEHDSAWLRDVVQAKLHHLLAAHSVVIFAEADEFLLATPGGRYRDLLDACEQLLADPAQHWIRAEGWQCMQAPNEPAARVVPGESLLLNRREVQVHTHYRKTLVTKVRIGWSLGFHGREEGGRRWHNIDPVDADLSLLHLWTLDAAQFMKRRGQRMKSWGQLEKWPDMWEAFRDPENSCRLGEAKPVPEEWRRLLVW